MNECLKQMARNLEAQQKAVVKVLNQNQILIKQNERLLTSISQIVKRL